MKNTPEASHVVVAGAGRDVPELGVKAGDELMESRIVPGNGQAMVAEMQEQFPVSRFATRIIVGGEQTVAEVDAGSRVVEQTFRKMIAEFPANLPGVEIAEHLDQTIPAPVSKENCPPPNTSGDTHLVSVRLSGTTDEALTKHETRMLYVLRSVLWVFPLAGGLIV